MNRRTLLRGSGVTIALPLMESLLPCSAKTVERVSRTPRLAAVTVPFGMVLNRFHPTETGRDYQLTPTLKPLEAHKSDFTVFSNLDHDVNGGHAANHALLSGVKSTEKGSYPDGNITIDQRVAEIFGHETRFPSLSFYGDGMSFSRTGVKIPGIERPSDAFKLMFIDDTAEQKKRDHEALNASGSILDTVLEDAKFFKRKLGQQDQDKLEEYFTSIRETEKKLEIADKWIDAPKPKMDDPEMRKIANGLRDENLGGNLVEVWMDLMYLALQTDSTRVVTMSVTNCNWGLAGVTDGYHSLSHHGMRPEKLEQLDIIETYLMENLAKLIDRLKTTKLPDDSSLLNSTQLFFGSGLGSGSRHTNSNLPLILAGGGFEHGRHIDAQRKQPLCNLYLSMLQQMGAEENYFNRSLSTFTGLKAKS